MEPFNRDSGPSAQRWAVNLMWKSFRFELCDWLSSSPAGGAEGAGRRPEAGCDTPHVTTHARAAITAALMSPRAI